MATEMDNPRKPKCLQDFKRVAEPVLIKLAKDATCSGHPRRSTLARDAFELIQNLLSYVDSREQAADSRRTEIVRLNAQLQALQGVVRSDVIVSRPTDAAAAEDGQGAQP